MDVLNLTKKYFEAFSNKNIEKLSLIYSENVTLIDWDIDINGKNKVLKANSELFNLNFQLIINSIYVLDKKTFNEITIIINEEELKIIDVIDFDDDSKIKSIVAYKR